MNENLEEQEEEQTYQSVLTEWMQNASTNGIPAIERSNHIIRKSLWILIVLVGTAGTSWQIVKVFQQYFCYPVSINVNVTFVENIIFPAVTICNSNIVRLSKIGLTGNTFSSLLTLAHGGNDSNHIEKSVQRIFLREQFDELWAGLEDSVKAEMGHQKEHMILDCVFNGQECSADNFTHFLNPEFGNCYTFNNHWNDEETLSVHKSGSAYGLQVELFLEQEEYIAELTEGAGMRVSIHGTKQMPFPEDNSILVAPGTQTFMAATVLNITRQKHPYPSKCWDTSHTVAKEYSAYSEMYNTSYDVHSCQKTCYQAHVLETCFCADPRFPMDGDAILQFVQNDTFQIKPCNPIRDRDCVASVKQHYIDGTLNCHCGTPCNDVEYSPVISAAQWPSAEFENIYFEFLKTTNPHVAHIVGNSMHPQLHFAKVGVFFTELNYEAIEEVVAYPLASLLSDLGGAVGFYMGLSVVACFEFIELIIDVIKLSIIKMSRGKKSKKTSKITVHPSEPKLPLD